MKEGLEKVGQFCDELDRDWQRLKEPCDVDVVCSVWLVVLSVLLG